MIDERPKHIELRRQPGHWEGDTVMGKAGEKEYIVMLVDRATGCVLIGKLLNCTVEETNQRILRLIRKVGLSFLTLTR